MVLSLVEELVGIHFQNVRLCVTSRPEVDIRNILEPLTSASNRIFLHVKVSQLLLQHCGGVDVRDSDGQTPLHVAVHQENRNRQV